jgi:hypothetical protein
MRTNIFPAVMLMMVYTLSRGVLPNSQVAISWLAFLSKGWSSWYPPLSVMRRTCRSWGVSLCGWGTEQIEEGSGAQLDWWAARTPQDVSRGTARHRLRAQLPCDTQLENHFLCAEKMQTEDSALEVQGLVATAELWGSLGSSSQP